MATEMAETGAATAGKTELEQLIEAERLRFGVPGCAVAVVRGDEVLVSRGFGSVDMAGTRPVTDQTLFAIGSSTKAFTSSLAGALVDDGLLEWDRPVRHYLPRLRLHDPVASELLTVRDALSHRSGLPRHDMLWYGNQSLRREDLLTRLEHLPSSRGFRELWQYNNLMYILAGYLSGELMGCTWEEGVQRRLLDPLGMGNTNFHVEESQRSSDHARPHAPRPEGLVEVPFRGLDLAGPAGSINSCIADMTRWVMCQVNGGVAGGTQVISPAALKELHKPAMVLPEEATDALWPEATNVAYALGWFVMSYRGHRALHHGGDIDGFATMVALLPAERIGVVVLCNVDPCGLRDALPYIVWDHLLGLEPLPWGERFKGMYDSLLGGYRAAAAHKKAAAISAPPSRPLEAYAGRYHHPGYGDVTITLEDGVLVPHYNDLALGMEHRHYDTWAMTLPEPDFPPIDMVFDAAADGSIAALRMPMELLVEPAVFRRMPDDRLSDPAVLRECTGRYTMAPLHMDVELDKQGRLVADIVGQGRFTLTPRGERRFEAAEMPALSFEFVTGESGVITSVVVDPVGVWQREGSSPLPS
jgi:CubicO group peptidase (beta-lactamase class C family)